MKSSYGSYTRDWTRRCIAILPKEEFTIFSLEELLDQFRNSKPERLEDLEIIVVKTGGGMLARDTNAFTLESNSIYCIVPGQVRYLKPDPGGTGYVLRIASEFLQQVQDSSDICLMVEFALKGQVPLTIENELNFRQLEEFIMKGKKEFENNAFGQREIIREVIKIFMIYLLREFNLINGSDIDDKKVKLLWNFYSLLQRQQAISKKQVSDYADELCVTPNYLNSVIKKITGVTASYHIQQHIIMEAKRHAIYSRLQVKEIAGNLGFYDGAHFSKFFKKYSGTTFSSFRKTITRWNG